MPGVAATVKAHVIDIMTNGDFWEFATTECAKMWEGRDPPPALPPVAEAAEFIRTSCLEVRKWSVQKQMLWRKQYKADGSANEKIVRMVMDKGNHTRMRVYDKGNPRLFCSGAPIEYIDEAVQIVLASGLTEEHNKIMADLIEYEQVNPKEKNSRGRQIEMEWAAVDANREYCLSIFYNIPHKLARESRLYCTRTLHCVAV